MKVTHELRFSRKCPIDESTDFYDLKVETEGIIKVEAILEAVASLPDKEFQEVLTASLAAKLRCRVTTIGHHSGVKTTCEA